MTGLTGMRCILTALTMLSRRRGGRMGRHRARERFVIVVGMLAGGDVTLIMLLAVCLMMRRTMGRRRPCLRSRGSRSAGLLTRRGGTRRLRKFILQSAYNRCLNRRGSRFHELPHVLELLKDGLAVNAKLLGQFIYALFCHSVFSLFRGRALLTGAVTL